MFRQRMRKNALVALTFTVFYTIIMTVTYKYRTVQITFKKDCYTKISHLIKLPITKVKNNLKLWPGRWNSNGMNIICIVFVQSIYKANINVMISYFKMRNYLTRFSTFWGVLLKFPFCLIWVMSNSLSDISS